MGKHSSHQFVEEFHGIPSNSRLFGWYKKPILEWSSPVCGSLGPHPRCLPKVITGVEAWISGEVPLRDVGYLLASGNLTKVASTSKHLDLGSFIVQDSFQLKHDTMISRGSRFRRLACILPTTYTLRSHQTPVDNASNMNSCWNHFHMIPHSENSKLLEDFVINFNNLRKSWNKIIQFWKIEKNNNLELEHHFLSVT